MYLYNLTIQKPTSIYHSIVGNFSGTKQIEILVSHGRSLELLRPDETNGKITSVLYTEVFGLIRSIAPFRLTSGTKDYIIIGSESGRVVILEYNPNKNRFEKVHQETFGRTGCRRIVPGQYLATDPRGRAFMIGAIEKQKLVYILNRDSAARLTISSPLEAHKSHTILFAMCGVDVGFENPIFATLSVDYSDDTDLEEMEDNHSKMMLTFYELDLGLNNVVRKWSEEVESSSNLLMTVPGGSDGPGGILVCSEGYITYRNIGHPLLRVQIPRRTGTPYDSKGVIIVSHSSHKQRDMFFFLVQSELGDLYKISLQYEGETVSAIKISYFDTIPTANCISVLRNGFLFMAAEFGDHSLYHIQSLGDDSASDIREIDGVSYFNVRKNLVNLLQTTTMNSLSPILDFKVMDLVNEEQPQIYALTGVADRSAMRVLRYGLPIAQIAGTPLPGIPSGLWTIPRSQEDSIDKYIVVSFIGSTLVLSVGETVEEVVDSGILATTTSILVRPIGADSIIQVFPHGIRHIKGDRRINEWRAPGRKTISLATSNATQVVIALGGGEVIYFELDAAGNLSEVAKKEFRREISALEIAPVRKGRQMARFVAIGDWEGPVRVLSLDKDNLLNQVSVLDTERMHIESLMMNEMTIGVEMPEGTASSSSAIAKQQQLQNQSNQVLFLNVGLKNGVMKRAVVDPITGELSDTRTRLLGRKPVKFSRVKLKSGNAVLALSSRVWLCYVNQGRYDMVPVSVEPLDNASGFSSEHCPDGIVATSENNLKIFVIEKLSEKFNQVNVPYKCTPRRFVVHPQTHYIVSIETEHNYLNELPTPKENGSNKMAEDKDPEVKREGDDMDYEVDQFSLNQNDKPPKAGDGKWLSYIRVLEPVSYRTLDLVKLDQDEAAYSLATCIFHDREGEVFLAVGCGKGVQLNPRKVESASIHLYRFTNNGQTLQLVYKTEVEEVPYAISHFQGRLLVGIANQLRIYEMGKKKLLRKCENKTLPNRIITMHTQGDRIIVGDVQESFHYAKYKKSENQLYVFADDTSPRFVTASAMLDYDTVAGADKFGNIFINRLPASVSDEVEEDPTGSKLKFESGYLNGAPHKLENIINFYVGETVNHISKTSLSVGGPEVLVYATLNGTIGALVPFVSREDVDFYTSLELQMRQENPPLCGRDHLAYRSYYFPVKNVIDGDLCEQYISLDPTKQQSIAEELSRSPSEILKKLEDLRSSKLY